MISTFRRPEFVSRAIDCVLGQEGVAVDVVVVDDNSQDGTPDVLRERYGSDIRVAVQSANGGVARARNRGLTEARGRFVAFLDDDDVWSATKLRSHVDALTRTNSTWSCSDVVVCDERLSPIRIDPVTRAKPFAKYALEHYPVPAAFSNIVADTAAIRTLGGFDTAYFHNADWDLVIRLALTSDPIIVGTPDVGYVLHYASVSGSPPGKYEDLERLEAKYASERTALGARSSRLESLRWIGMSAARFSQPTGAAGAYIRAFGLSRAPYDLVRAGAVFLPRYGRLMDWRQARRLRRTGNRPDIAWLADRASAAEDPLVPTPVPA